MRSTAEAAYVIVVAAIASCGFAAGSTALILLATLLALPSGVVALVGYYLAYGLLTLVPGANPTSGGLATWFAVTTTLLGILAPVVAAWVNVVLLRLVVRRRDRRMPVDDDSRPAAPAS